MLLTSGLHGVLLMTYSDTRKLRFLLCEEVKRSTKRSTGEPGVLSAVVRINKDYELEIDNKILYSPLSNYSCRMNCRWADLGLD